MGVSFLAPGVSGIRGSVVAEIARKRHGEKDIIWVIAQAPPLI